MTELEEDAICNCGESTIGTVIVFQGNTEHHCRWPVACWTEMRFPKFPEDK